MTTYDPARAVGRAVEQLTVAERLRLVGQCAAFEVYTPKTVPFRFIEALGDSVTECVRQLQARGLDPRQYEFVRLQPVF
jgi:hypothetical protein